MVVDPRAQTGFSGTAASYERGRPSYPAEAVRHVTHALGLSATSTVIDLAAGTGKLTRLLPGQVVAVDPSATMLDALRSQLPEVEARAGSAEAIPAADGSIDAVFVGQAFHWFRAPEAAREIGRVLAPGGGLALLWNRGRWATAGHAWLAEFNALVKPYRSAAGPFPASDAQWREAIEGARLFAPLASAEFEHVHRIGPDDFVALVASWSWIANIPEPERGGVLTRVRELAGDEEVALPYVTEVHWTRRAA